MRTKTSSAHGCFSILCSDTVTRDVGLNRGAGLSRGWMGRGGARQRMGFKRWGDGEGSGRQNYVIAEIQRKTMN